MIVKPQQFSINTKFPATNTVPDLRFQEYTRQLTLLRNFQETLRRQGLNQAFQTVDFDDLTETSRLPGKNHARVVVRDPMRTRHVFKGFDFEYFVQHGPDFHEHQRNTMLHEIRTLAALPIHPNIMPCPDTLAIVIFNLVKGAKSSVRLSFDLWPASNGFHYISIVGHFVDSEGEKRDVLLGLPRLVGPHSGESMAPYVKEVIDQYEMGFKLGYFMLDNAESNDTCLETLARWFPMDISRRRLRCIGHIINLVVRAIIFGSNVTKFEAELRGATDEFSFEIWAKKRAIGRLHNLATYIRNMSNDDVQRKADN
ncbi:Zinc finger BED domain-containing protein RICESLEEPER 1 like [Verticillium longisporum]|nr:Zinc finger BED domain-containing protein RICESLEEPER 1 like [Verticillium longisporum]